MPRQSRILSSTGIYHIMMRGNEKKDIFLCENDKVKFLNILRDKKKENEYELYAYCLMDNHIHLLIKENKDSIARIMKRINTSYANYFNKKYSRVGHVFQDRYKSETIESEGSLLQVIRYIHNNPVKAGIVSSPQMYLWSSFHLYLKGDKETIESGEILGIYSTDNKKALKLFKEYGSQRGDTFLDVENEQEKQELILSKIQEFLLMKNKKLKDIQEDKNVRNQLIKILKEDSKLSIRKIAETMDIDRNIVQRVK